MDSVLCCLQHLFLLMRVRKLIKAKGILIRIIADTWVLSRANLQFLKRTFILARAAHRAKERLFVILRSEPCLAIGGGSYNRADRVTKFELEFSASQRECETGYLNASNKTTKHEIVRAAGSNTHLSSIWKTICFIGHFQIMQPNREMKWMPWHQLILDWCLVGWPCREKRN